MHDRIWARSTIEELLSRQFVSPTACAARAIARRQQPQTVTGVFRPGLRVVALDGPQDRWLDDPVPVTIEG